MCCSPSLLVVVRGPAARVCAYLMRDSLITGLRQDVHTPPSCLSAFVRRTRWATRAALNASVYVSPPPLLRTRRRHSCRAHARLASPHALPALVPLAKGIRADSLGILHSHLRRWYAGRALAGEVKVKTQSRECGWPLAAAGLIPGCQACLTSATEKCTALPNHHP